MFVRRGYMDKARIDLFHADNPSENIAGNQHWGHATSTDLYHWENQAIAIFPGAEGEGIFSGSSVIDVNNTSGFFPNQTNGVVAMYTLNTAEEETQEIPMLSNISVENPLDPSNFASNDMYVLTVSINPGAPLGGSITQAFPGTFNGTHFAPVDQVARITDFGKDNYAGQFFYGIPPTSPQISIAWASNWQYTQVVPTGDSENFRSAMSLPRYNVLANTTRGDYTFVSLPYDLSPLYTMTSPLANSTSLANASLLYDYSRTVPSGALTFNMTVTSIPAENVTGTTNFTFMSSVTGESIRGGFYLGGDTPFFINRGYIRGFDNPFFTDKFSTNNLVSVDTQTFRLQVVIDRSIMEVFLDNGLRSATTTFFAEGELDTLIVSSAELSPGIAVSVDVYGLNRYVVSYIVGRVPK
ncbi:MAG: hypothetical protein Q9197_003833 [Variospora fuerteventurae]